MYFNNNNYMKMVIPREAQLTDDQPGKTDLFHVKDIRETYFRKAAKMDLVNNIGILYVIWAAKLL